MSTIEAYMAELAAALKVRGTVRRRFQRRPRHDGVHRQRASSSSKSGQRA
jgi:hypothetical protein